MRFAATIALILFGLVGAQDTPAPDAVAPVDVDMVKLQAQYQRANEMHNEALKLAQDGSERAAIPGMHLISIYSCSCALFDRSLQ